MTTPITKAIKNDVLKGLKEIDEIRSFEDIERLFLRGAGNSPLTYKVYRNKIKLFYDFTKGLHPVLVKPADIEAFYDDRIQKVDRKTAYLDIQALKCFFKGVKRIIGTIYSSPFERMPEKLLKKLNRNKQNGTKIWTFKTRGDVDSSPVICGNKVVVGSNDGRLYMLNLSDGTLVWSYEIGEAIASSPTVAGGKIIIGSEDGRIYAYGESSQ